MYVGDFTPGKTITKKFNTASFADGSPITLAGTPVISVYKSGSTTESTAGVTLSVDYDSRTGLHNVAIDTSADGTFYAAGNDFEIVITVGTVGGTSVVGRCVGTFSLSNRSALRPTTADRTLDVSAGGEAGVDWANVGSPTTTLNLSGTTVKAVTDNVNAVLANTSHGGTSATLRLGGSTSTPPFYVTNSGGNAVQFEATGANGLGLDVLGNGTGSGMRATGGATGDGFQVLGGATSGDGLHAEAQTDGYGLHFHGKLTGGGALFEAGSGNANGIVVQGSGTSAGLRVVGGATGNGFEIVGGGTSGDGVSISTTSGDGIDIAPTAGHGIDVTANGTSKHGVNVTGGTGGTSDGIKATAGTGGVDIRGSITGDLVGTVSTLTTYTGNTPQTADHTASIAAILADTGTDGVVVAAASKTGYSLTATTGLGNQTANITGSLSGSVGSVTGAVGSVTGAVGSVTGNVGGNVTGSVGSVVGAVGSVTGAVGSVTGNVGGNVVGSVGSLTLGQVIPMVDVSAETTVTLGRALLAALVQGAGSWSVVGTTLELLNPDGSVFRTFSLDSAVTPTSRT